MRRTRLSLLAVVLLGLCLTLGTVFSPDPFSRLLRGAVERHTNGYILAVATRSREGELFWSDRALLQLGVRVGILAYSSKYPEASLLLRHYIDGDGVDLILDPDLFRESPVILSALESRGVGTHGPIGFHQHEDWGLSLCLNPFFLEVTSDSVRVFHPRITFARQTGPLVPTVVPLGLLRFRVYDNLISALGGTPFYVYAEWES